MTFFFFEIRPFSCKMTFSTVNKVIFCDNFHRKNFVKIYADVSLAWIWTRWAWDWLKIVLVGYVWNGLSPRSLEWTLVWGFTFLKSDRVWNWMWTSRWVTIYSSIMSSPSFPLFFTCVIFMKFWEILWNFLRFLSNSSQNFSIFQEP